jgi:hypothetical protein
MNGFVDLHGESITGVINTFDRVIFKVNQRRRHLFRRSVEAEFSW